MLGPRGALAASRRLSQPRALGPRPPQGRPRLRRLQVVSLGPRAFELSFPQGKTGSRRHQASLLLLQAATRSCFTVWEALSLPSVTAIPPSCQTGGPRVTQRRRLVRVQGKGRVTLARPLDVSAVRSPVPQGRHGAQDSLHLARPSLGEVRLKPRPRGELLKRLLLRLTFRQGTGVEG